MTSLFYRVSTATMYDSAMRNLQARQSTLVNLQENLTSGKRVVRPSDDPVAAAQAERSLTRISRIQAEQRALETQRNTIAQAETTLGDAVDLIQQIRDLVVGAGNGSFSKPEDYKTQANQIQSLRDQLVEVINRKDTNGQPLLGALGSAVKPFVSSLLSSDYLFNGLPGQASSSGTDVSSLLDGHAAFMFDPVRDGIYEAAISPRGAGSSLTTTTVTTSNRDLLDGASYALQIDSITEDPVTGTSVTYTLTKTDKNGVVSTTTGTAGPVVDGKPIPIEIQESGQTVVSFSLKGTAAVGDTVVLKPSSSIMGTIDSAISGIGASTNKTDAVQAVQQALANIDAGLERVMQVRSYAGELLNRADRISNDQTQRSIQLESDRSRAEDLDMLKGVTDFQNANVGYQAALQSYAQVARISLFDYMK